MRSVLCCAIVTQSRPIHCDPMDCSPPGPLSMGFSRQEYWSVLPWSPPRNLPNPGVKPRSPAMQADSLLSESPKKPFIRSIGVQTRYQRLTHPKKENYGNEEGNPLIPILLQALSGKKKQSSHLQATLVKCLWVFWSFWEEHSQESAM